VAHEPSLYNLFRRSRYAGKTSDGKADCNQREIFAVAALAFVLKHDPAFKKFFIQRALGEKEAVPENVNIVCQEAHCADLSLSTKSTLWVVEAKIGAKLKKKQDPDSDAFWKKGGYGDQLIKRREPRRIKYLVLDQKKHGERRKRKKGIEYGFLSWDELLRATESPLVYELLNSLGKLGIACCTDRILNQNSEMRNQLESVCEKLNVRSPASAAKGRSEVQWEIDWPAHDCANGYFGLNIKRGAPLLKKLKDAIPRNTIGWFGFERVNGKLRSSIWFYQASKKAAAILNRFPHGRFIIKDGCLMAKVSGIAALNRILKQTLK
jgi:hypothetical protein